MQRLDRWIEEEEQDRERLPRNRLPARQPRSLSRGLPATARAKCLGWKKPCRWRWQRSTHALLPLPPSVLMGWHIMGKGRDGITVLGLRRCNFANVSLSLSRVMMTD